MTTANVRQLLVTTTGEPLQPVRLYYTIPNKRAVTRVFERLRCMVDTKAEGWLWHYEDEAAAMALSKRPEDLPSEVRPIIVGSLRFPSKDTMVLHVRSFDRAIEAAKFFGPLLGPQVVLRRARLLNRFLDAAENARGLDHIDRMLDKDVVTIDPAEMEAKLAAAFAAYATPEAAYAAVAEERKKVDVPTVEDFPLAPEEETEDFQHLMLTLRFRAIRCFLHWKGNTTITLSEVIRRVVEEGGRGLGLGPNPLA